MGKQEYDPNDFAHNEQMFLDDYHNSKFYEPQTPHDNRSENQRHSTLTQDDFERLGIERVDDSEAQEKPTCKDDA